jgi:hypothetical protein
MTFEWAILRPMGLRLKSRFYVPIVLLLVVAAVLAVVLYWKAGPSEREVIEFGSAVLGGIVAIYGLLLNVQSARNAAARRFLERWTDPQFDEYRKELWKMLHTTDKTLESMDRRKVVTILDFWEELAIAVLRQEADEPILKDFFYSVALLCYRAAASWIVDNRQSLNQPTAYRQFQNLYERWEPK